MNADGKPSDWYGTPERSRQDKPIKTADQVMQELRQRGITLSEKARQLGVKRTTVVDVLHGRAKGHYGEAHVVAVRLGIKDGEVIEQTPAAAPRRTSKKALQAA